MRILGGVEGVERCRLGVCAAGSCRISRERSSFIGEADWGWGGGGGGAPVGWPATGATASPWITMEIHISDRTHKFQNKTGLDAKDNSELYKSKQVNSVA